MLFLVYGPGWRNWQGGLSSDPEVRGSNPVSAVSGGLFQAD